MGKLKFYLVLGRLWCTCDPNSVRIHDEIKVTEKPEVNLYFDLIQEDNADMSAISLEIHIRVRT